MVRKYAIEYSKERKRKHNNIKLDKEKELKRLLTEEKSDNENIQHRIEIVKTELEEIILKEAEVEQNDTNKVKRVQHTSLIWKNNVL
jgi:hypothetical protein